MATKKTKYIEHNGKLDIGCGKNKKEGFTGLDQFAMEGVDHVIDVRVAPWPIASDSVEEVHCSHFVEHLTGEERVTFYNELYRVMKKDAKAAVITPHWNSNRAYGDFTHQWPPVSEMSFYYLSKDWRETQAPHTDSRWNPKGYNCHFAATWGYSMHPEIVSRSQDYQQMAMNFFKEACQDLYATLVKV
jgi:cyclopropane fatty-acyl-phospholipid synthase-like methyltransferase